PTALTGSSTGRQPWSPSSITAFSTAMGSTRRSGPTVAASSCFSSTSRGCSVRDTCLDFSTTRLVKQEALQRSAFAAPMLNVEGDVPACTTPSMFFVRTGRLSTTSIACGILHGITREVVLLLAQERGLPVEEGAYTVD